MILQKKGGDKIKSKQIENNKEDQKVIRRLNSIIEKHAKAPRQRSHENSVRNINNDKMNQEGSNNDVEISESDTDEGMDRVRSPWRCFQCRRPCSEHKGQIGTICKLEPLNEEQGEERPREWNIRRRKNKTSVRGIRSTSASSVPEMAGSAPSGSTEPLKATSEAESLLEARIVQRLLAVLSSVPPNPGYSQGRERERRGSTPQYDLAPNMSQRQQTDRQQVQQQPQLQEGQNQHQAGPQYYPPPRLYMQPLPVPIFPKTMSVKGWTKAVRAWSNNLHHIPETTKLTMIMESLKANEERKGVGRWIVSTVDKGDFNTERQGALEEFMELFKKKYEVPCWRKCIEICEQVLAFQKNGDEGPNKYLERWLELED